MNYLIASNLARRCWTRLDEFGKEEFAALVIPQPNFFGVLEEVDALTDWAHGKNALAIGVVNPTALAILTPPGEWGEKGADIAVGEGQPLGIPLSSGGPYFGFMACKQALVRQMPGRIIGRTTDQDGKAGFVLTLQAREQHIRRSKATSNICTNQGLMVTAATIYMALAGTGRPAPDCCPISCKHTRSAGKIGRLEGSKEGLQWPGVSRSSDFTARSGRGCTGQRLKRNGYWADLNLEGFLSGTWQCDARMRHRDENFRGSGKLRRTLEESDQRLTI